MNKLLATVFTQKQKDPTLQKLKFALSTGSIRFIDTQGEYIIFPASVQKALEYFVSILSRGQSVLVVPQVKYLSCNDTAKILGCSRPYVYKLLDEKIIPYHYVGSHRRICLEDIIAYGESLDQNRHQQVLKMVEITEEIKKQRH
jgi:excisionase family DNA binding protein